MPSAKLQALISALVAGSGSFIGWFLNTPPEQQSGMLASLVELVPAPHRANAALIARAIGILAGFYAAYSLHVSNPSQPTQPPQPPTK